VERSLVDQVWRRANGICEYCLLPQEFDRLPFQIDHIIARKHRGSDDTDNLALACFACNIHKGPNIAGVDPNTGDVIRLFHPRRDNWEEHFEWRGASLVGRTPIGRVTVDVLEINLPHRIRLREMLIAESVFPGRRVSG